jgi:hypothetical protein
MSPICDDVGMVVRQRVRTIRTIAPEGARVKRTRWILAALTTALVATACGAGSDNDNDDVSADSTAPPTASSSTTPETSTTTSPEATAAPTPESTAAATTATTGANCFDGEWTISEIAASDATITVSGVVEGMTMTFAPGTWTLRATDASIPAEVAGTTVTLSLDGEATGQVATLGDRLQFALDDAEGTATVAAAGLEEELTFEDVIVALGPTGEATSTCSATAATLTTATTTIDLTRDAPASDTAPSTTVTVDAVLIDEPGATLSHACDGSAVTIISGETVVTLTGDCPTVTVTGGGNTVSVDRVGEIVVSGADNDVRWGAALDGTAPAITDTGFGNSIVQG